jgi:hypothetical protein
MVQTTQRTKKSVEVFYSYAPEDESLRQELERHLSVLRQQGIITATTNCCWCSRKAR